MRARVRNDAIGTVGRVASAAVSHNRMIRNTWGDRQFVDGFHKPIVRLQRIHAIRHAIQLSGGRVGAKKRFGCGVDRYEPLWSSDESGTDAADPVRRQFAPSMRS